MDRQENKPEVPVSEYRAHQLKKHEGWNTSAETVEDIVRKATGSEIAEQKRIVDGESNEVYAVKTEAGEEIFVRLYHGEKSKFEKSRWAIEQSALVGVSVSKVLATGTLELNDKPLHFSVETKVEGVSLDQAVDVAGEEREEILPRLGETLSKVHSVKTDGFGKLDKDGKGMFASVPGLIAGDKYIRREKILPFFENRPEDVKTVERAYEILECEAQKYTETESRLIHNDLSPKHVLVKDHEVSLIDFDDATGGDPMLELALWDFKFGKDFPLELIQQGYTNKEVFSEGWEERLNFWKIYRAFSSLRYCIDAQKQSAIERNLRVIKESSAYFE